MEQKDVKEEDRQNFFLRLEEEKQKLEKDIEATKPNVLIYGMTGAGKSSLINRLFGSEIAQVGTGVPITQSFELYSHKDLRVNIYDSKGLELGQPESNLQKTREFLAHLQDQKKPIHMIWFVVSASNARLHPFETEIINTEFADYPLLTVLSKKDSATPEQISDLTRLCQSQSACLGVYPITTREPVPDKVFTHCPECNSEDLVIRTSVHKVLCVACNRQDSTLNDSGLEELVQGTTGHLPTMVAYSFHIAQRITLEWQDQKAKNLIQTLWEENDNLGYGAKYNNLFIKMLVDLGDLLDLKLTGQGIGRLLSKEESCNLITGCLYTSIDTVRQLLGKETTARLFITAKAIYWYRRLRAAKIDLIFDRLHRVTLSSYKEEHNEVAGFQQRLDQEGLESVLSDKLPTLKELRQNLKLNK